jgi:hypothetical protein
MEVHRRFGITYCLVNLALFAAHFLLILLGLLFGPEDVGTMFISKVRELLSD